MQTKIIERYFFFGLLLATFFFTFLIFRPFWIVLVLGACFAIVLYPIYNWLTKRKLSSWLSSFLTVIFFTIIICGPVFGIGVLVFHQTQNVYHAVVENGAAGAFIETINHNVNELLPNGVVFNASEKVVSLISFLENNVTQIFSATFSTLFSFILIILSIFYFLKDGTKWKNALIKLSPLSDTNDQKIISRLTQTINGVIKGTLLVALVQGVLMGIGLAVFHVPNPALWGVIAAIVSLIPSFGTSLVSVPAIIFLYATGHVMQAIGLVIWAGALVGMIDNLLSPYIVSTKVKIPAFIILFAVLGGITLLGPVGILIGPLVVSLLYTLVSIYRNEFQHTSVL